MRISILTTHLQPRLIYTIDYINQHPNTPEGWKLELNGQQSEIEIRYSDLRGTEVTIPKAKAYFTNSNSSSIIQAFDYEGIPVYGLVEKKSESLAFFSNRNFGFDIFETIFFHISRYEEVFADKSDFSIAGWLKEEQHLLVQHSLEKIPVVDQLISSFFSVLKAKQVEKDTTFSLSHDIDILYRFRPLHKIFRSILAMVYHKRGFEHFFKSLNLMWKQIVYQAKDPYDTYDWLFSQRHFINKRLFLMSGGNTKHDNLYNINDPKILEIIDLARSRRYDIGLHPSFNAGFNGDLYSNEKEKLANIVGEKISLSRQHWLRWSWTSTPQILTHNKITEDSTIGYAKRIGFRAGTGFPYHLYNFENEKAYSWKEIPFAYMESALIHESLRSGIPLEKLSEKFLKTNRYNTHIEMNWHNSNFDTSMWYGPILKKLFLSINNKHS